MRRPSGRLIPNAAQSKLESVCGERARTKLACGFRSLSTCVEDALRWSEAEEVGRVETLRCRESGRNRLSPVQDSKSTMLCVAWETPHLEVPL